jgi:hypothetical protein
MRHGLLRPTLTLKSHHTEKILPVLIVLIIVPLMIGLVKKATVVFKIALVEEAFISVQKNLLEKLFRVMISISNSEKCDV